MKKAFLSCALLLAAATAAPAAGLNLAWNNCAGDAGVQNIAFACDTNTGNRSLVCSIVLGRDIPDLVQGELVVDLVSASATLPDWWGFLTAGSCRQVSLFLFEHEGTNCPGFFAPAAATVVGAYQPGKHGLPNEARLLSIHGVLAADAVTRFAGQEYGIARWTIMNTKTVGTPSCTGCQTPVCLVFNSARFTTPADTPVGTLLTGAANPGSDYVTWQGGAGTNCPAATPTKNATWGSVKSLYR